MEAIESGEADAEKEQLEGGNYLEAVYQWIQQIAVFAVISFLVLYLMGSQEKKFTLRFYLSLLMLLLILKPAAAFFKLDTILAEKMTELETNTEIAVMSDQIQQMGELQDQKILDDTSQKAISWIQGMVQDKDLNFLEGEILFDEQTLEQTGEVILSGVKITVSRAGKSLAEIQPVLKELEEEIADTFTLKKSSVTVKSSNQESDHQAHSNGN